MWGQLYSPPRECENPAFTRETVNPSLRGWLMSGVSLLSTEDTPKIAGPPPPSLRWDSVMSPRSPHSSSSAPANVTATASASYPCDQAPA